MGTGVLTSLKNKKASLKPGKELYRKLVFGVPENLNEPLFLYRYLLIPINKVQK
jgi:hypothetical protein